MTLQHTYLKAASNTNTIHLALVLVLRPLAFSARASSADTISTRSVSNVDASAMSVGMMRPGCKTDVQTPTDNMVVFAARG
jgi:hypothetical protein